MAKTPRMPMRSDSSDYHQGYLDGRKSVFEDSELDAYYAGVGYGKKSTSTKHMGFTNDEERRQFEMGISNSHKHFRAYRAEPLTFWERLFGRKKFRADQIHVADRRSAVQRKAKKTLSYQQQKKRKLDRNVRKGVRRAIKLSEKQFKRYSPK